MPKLRSWISLAPLVALCMIGGRAASTDAAEIKVLSTMNIRPALDELRAPFESATGHKVTIDSKGAAETRRRIEQGEAGDVAINARPVLELLLQAGKLRQGSITDVAHSSIGVVVREGATKPQIATDEALKRTLIAAASIAYPDPAGGSLGGNYFAELIGRWGIAEQLKSKIKLARGGAGAGQIVAAGGAELGVNQIAEIMTVPGIEFVTPLPPALTGKVVMAAAILPGAKEPDAGAAWIKFLASPAAAAALRAHGMEP